MNFQSSDESHYLAWLVFVAAVGILLYLLAPILAPFLFAAILAYICNPLVARLVRHKVPRGLAAALVLFLLIGIFAVLLFVLLPLLVRQVRAVAEHMPTYMEWVRGNVLPWVNRNFGVEVDSQFVREWLTGHAEQIQAFALKMLPTLTAGGGAVLQFVLNLVLVPIVLYYLLRDWDKLVASIDVMIPRRWHDITTRILRDIDKVLGEFLRGQLLVMLIMTVVYIVGLWMAGLDYALSVGLIAGLVTFVPYLGVVTGVTLATLSGLLQFGDLHSLIWVWLVFVVANVLEGYVFVPWLVGDRIGLHPVTVIFALLAFGEIFGFFGVLLALPASAALLVGLRYMRAHYLGSGAYGAGV